MIHKSTRLIGIREKLCLEQRSMAMYLEISRPLLSLIELGKRSEPAAVKKHLDELDALLFTKNALASEEKAIQSRKRKTSLNDLKKEIRGLTIKLGFAKKTLEKVEADYLKYAVALHSFQILIDNAESSGKKPNPVWRQQLYKLDEKLLDCDLARQELLRSQIKGLQAEITHLETAVAGKR